MFVGLRRRWGSKVEQQHGLPSQKHPVSLWDLLHWSMLVSLASAHVATVDPGAGAAGDRERIRSLTHVYMQQVLHPCLLSDDVFHERLSALTAKCDFFLRSFMKFCTQKRLFRIKLGFKISL